MKTHIEKLIKEYDEKIEREEECDKIVEYYIDEALKEGKNYDTWAVDRRTIDARRQAYMQAKSDIISLLDHI